MAGFRMPPPLDQINPDPVAFMLSSVARFRTQFIDVINRTATRIGKTEHKVFPDGKTGVGKPIATIPLRASNGTTDAQLALQFCTLALENVLVLSDEVRRVSLGQPHGLEGETCSDGCRMPTQNELRLFGLFGGDEAVLIGFVALMTALVPLLTVLVPILLPPLISVVQSATGGFLNGGTAPSTEGASGTGTSSQGFLDVLSDPFVLGGMVLAAFLLLR